MELKISFGNHKLGDDTAIINMGTAKDCPARKLDMCWVVKKGIKCYAEKAEDQYPRTVPSYREAQKAYWTETSAEQIRTDLIKKFERRRKPTRYLRFNESGDFHGQQDVGKLSRIAESLEKRGITTYGYTARRDLDFRGSKFIVKGSGFTAEGINGSTIVIGKDKDKPRGYFICPGNCRYCTLCKVRAPINIAFRKH
jgi:hypothetical protein